MLAGAREPAEPYTQDHSLTCGDGPLEWTNEHGLSQFSWYMATVDYTVEYDLERRTRSVVGDPVVIEFVSEARNANEVVEDVPMKAEVQGSTLKLSGKGTLRINGSERAITCSASSNIYDEPWRPDEPENPALVPSAEPATAPLVP